MGEWDSSGSTEVLPAQDYPVSRTTIHPQFQAGNLKNDIAVLRLSNPVQLGQVCSPQNHC